MRRGERLETATVGPSVTLTGWGRVEPTQAHGSSPAKPTSSQLAVGCSRRPRPAVSYRQGTRPQLQQRRAERRRAGYVVTTSLNRITAPRRGPRHRCLRVRGQPRAADDRRTARRMVRSRVARHPPGHGRRGSRGGRAWQEPPRRRQLRPPCALAGPAAARRSGAPRHASRASPGSSARPQAAWASPGSSCEPRFS